MTERRIVASKLREILGEKGWAVAPERVSADLVEGCRRDLDNAYRVCRALQIRNGVERNTDGTVHHVVDLGDHFLRLLETLPILDVAGEYFGGKFILNSYGGVFNLPGSTPYVGKVHRDVRSFTGGLPLMLNVLIMLDDFTLENGATYLMEGSHRAADRPTDERFFAQAVRTVGEPGTVVVFDSNLWHAAGVNHTAIPRRALTLTLTPPYLKQQCDYPRLMAARIGGLSDSLRQLLGDYARIPVSLDEWYQPAEKRPYRPDQG